MEYTVEAVAKETGSYPTQYGTMVSYTVKFTGVSDPVEIGRKPDSPAPKVGDVLQGTINTTQYGKKFKQDYTANKPRSGGFGGGGQSAASKPAAEPFTMYLSYAKDLMVARVGAGDYSSMSGDDFSSMMDEVLTAAYRLFDGRPGAEEKSTKTDEDVTIDWTTE